MNVPEITTDELAKVKENKLSTQQLDFLFSKTPEKHIYKRPAKGGGQWSYVTGTYIKKVLNLMFGWDWDFEVVEYKYDIVIKQVFVLGKLTCRSNGKAITKMQFGRKEIICKKGTDIPLDLGNDLKAATTDALKKCANEIGIAADVYSPNEFKEIKVVDEKTKPELLPGTPEWQDALMALMNNGYTIEMIEKKYTISDSNKTKLKEDAGI
jgi:hypothetical protein